VRRRKFVHSRLAQLGLANKKPQIVSREVLELIELLRRSKKNNAKILPITHCDH
jgi:hypothetical protein